MRVNHVTVLSVSPSNIKGQIEKSLRPSLTLFVKQTSCETYKYKSGSWCVLAADVLFKATEVSVHALTQQCL